MSYEAKSTTSKSRRRRRTETAAIALLDGQIRLPPYQRRSALKRIRVSRQPTAEAKRIIAHTTRRGIEVPSDGIDYSAVQELGVKLIRRDGGIWEPQASLLREMDRRIALGEIDIEGFQELAAVVWAMRPALPKRFLQAGTKSPFRPHLIQSHSDHSRPSAIDHFDI